MEKLSHTENDKTRPIRVRCPDCFKQYSVDPTEVKSARPRFACNKCETKFWLAYPECLGQEAVIGFPLEWLEGEDATSQKSVEPPVESSVEASAQNSIENSVEPQKIPEEVTPIQPFNCPKCELPYSANDQECGSCGLVFAKFSERQKLEAEEVTGTPRLFKLWENILDDYEDLERHNHFFQVASEENNLAYAAYKYSNVLKGYAQDEIANSMQEKIMQFTMIKAESQRRVERPNAKKRRWFRLDAMAFLLCGSVIGAGYFIPGLQNLVGFGVAVLFFLLALKFYFRVL